MSPGCRSRSRSSGTSATWTGDCRARTFASPPSPAVPRYPPRPMSDATSASLFARARERIPGGVNSPVRAFRSVGGEPIFIRRAEGCWLEGADGTRYIDYVGSWGPMILGHAHASVVAAIAHAAADGTSFGAPTEREVILAETLCAAVPTMDMVRLTSSGTEAVMGALRAARGFTGRDLVVKFEGCYHG